jgi:hypothetical protein
MTFWPRSWPSWPIFATEDPGAAALGLLEPATLACTASTELLPFASSRYTPEMVRISAV